jgi:pimeloyl-ACP methyl ester carboxylesterase/acyl carrier protein
MTSDCLKLQVKVNGFRVELGEIEEILTKDAAVASAAATVFEGKLAAYVVPAVSGSAVGGSAVGGTADAADADAVQTRLRVLCAEKLPDYMVPHHWTMLEQVPLSPNGKVDRKRLPPPTRRSSAQQGAESGTSPAVEVPADAVEAAVREAMASILRLPVATLCCERSHFFRLGGDSVSALRLLLALRTALGTRLTVQQLFAQPTVRGICSQMHASAASAAASAATAATAAAHGGGSASSAVPSAGTPARQLRMVCLQPGDSSTHLPLFLVHPAGASSLCYLPLLRCLGHQRPVYAFDDSCLTDGGDFQLGSIAEVAAECLVLMSDALGLGGGAVASGAVAGGAMAGASPAVVLGGWSYGGVVALEMARQLEARSLEMAREDDPSPTSAAPPALHTFPTPLPAVHSVLMFDAPLGQTQGRGFHDPSTASDADGRPRLDANGSPRSDAVMQVLSWLPSMLIEPDCILLHLMYMVASECT